MTPEPEAAPRGERLYYLAAFLVLAAFGSYGVFIRWTGLKGADDHIVFWRALIALGCFLLVTVAARKTRELKVSRRELVLLFAGGALLAVQAFSSTMAINRLPVRDAVFLIYLAPVLLAIMAPVFLKEKLQRVTIAALVVAVGGLALITFGSGTSGASMSASGILFALLSAVCYSVLVIILKLLRETVSTLAVCVYENAVVVLVLLPFSGTHLPAISGRGWGSLVVLGVVHTCILSLLYVYLAKFVQAQHLGIVAYADPVASTLFAYALLGEVPSWISIVGGALIVGAGVLVLMFGTVAGEEAGAVPHS